MKRPQAISSDPTLWRRLKVGDRVRLVHMPTEFGRPGYYIHRDTLRAYRRLLMRTWPLRVCELDAWNMPWVRFQFRMKDGRWEYHSLLINHDGLRLVIPKVTRK